MACQIGSIGSLLQPLLSHSHTLVLQNRQHQTKAGDQTSTFLAINASIIQGSGLGPVSYIYLMPVTSIQCIQHTFQICGRHYLLVPATNSSLISHELKNISDWAIDNNLKLNSTKCYEMVVSLSNKNRPHIPPHCKT